MTIEVPAALVPQVEAFIDAIVREHPEEPDAARKIAVHALLHRGLLLSNDLKGLSKK